MKTYRTTPIILMCLLPLLAIGCGKRETVSNEKVLRYRMPTKVQTLDTGNKRGAYAAWVLAHICEGLYTYDYLPRPYEIITSLAADMPEISDDQLTYTIRIKQGVHFQDDPCFADGKGREVVADDFVYALKRIANVKYKSQNWSVIKDRFVGLDDFREDCKRFKKELDVDYSYQVEGLRALDKYTLQFKLVKPWPQIIDVLLTDNMSAPMPHEAVEYYGDDIIRHPIATGPYRLKMWQRGVYIDLVRNENFRGGVYPSTGGENDRQAGLLDDAGKPIPFADRVIWRVIEEDQPAWLLFMRGELDGTGIPKDNFNDAVSMSGMTESQDMRDRGIKLIYYNDPSVYWLGFNFKDPVLGKNLPLRKALSRAYDRDRQNELLANGRNLVAHGLVPPGLNSYDPDIKKYEFSKYDLAEAKELMKEAEKINGGPIPPIKLAMPGTDTFFRQYGQFSQRQFAKIGVKLEVDYMDWPTYLEGLNAGNFQMFASGVGAGSPDAVDFLEMFTTDEFAPGGNKFFYSNPEYDELFEKAEVMQFTDETRDMYRQLERMALSDYPAIFTSHRMYYVMVHDWLGNYKPHAFIGVGFGKSEYYKIDIEKRNAYKQRVKELKQKKSEAKSDG